MYLWTWVLTALCVAGLVLAIAPVFSVLALLKRVRSRAVDLRHARLFMSLESLQLQGTRLARLAQNAPDLGLRVRLALARIRSAREQSGYEQSRAAVFHAGDQVSALYTELQ